jgi:hypothetical protein
MEQYEVDFGHEHFKDFNKEISQDEPDFIIIRG